MTDARANASKTVRLRVRRQDGRDDPASRRWEEFEVPVTDELTVMGCLDHVRREPKTADGKDVAPVAFDAACNREACGSCAMLINGRVALACATPVAQASPKGKPIVLEPLSKFPVERDLVVDRSRMEESLVRVRAWTELDGTASASPAPAESVDHQAERYAIARCISCGACLEACPEYGPSSAFVGAAAIAEAHHEELHPSPSVHRRARVESLMTAGGVADCGKAQNCVEVCPVGVPLVESIGAMSRATSKHLLFGWLLK